MRKYTKAQVVQEFKGAFAGELEAMGNDRDAKNQRFFDWVDGLVKDGYVTQAQWRKWANPF